MTVIVFSSNTMHVQRVLLINWCSVLVLCLPAIQAQLQNTLKCRSDTDHGTHNLVCTCHSDSHPQAGALDEIGHLLNETTPLSQLSLHINDCSQLVLTTNFSLMWRERYTELNLTLTNIEEIRQEPSVNVPIIQALVISFSVVNSSIDTLFPGLVSHTEVLNFKLHNCNVTTLAKDAFASINTLHSFHILMSNIETWRAAMPRFVDLKSPPDATQDHYILFTNSTIGTMEASAMAIRMSSTELFSMSKTIINNLEDNAIEVQGSGHVIVADLNVTQASEKSFSVTLESPDKSQEVQSSAFILNSHIGQGSFLSSWRVINGLLDFSNSSFGDQTLARMAQMLQKPHTQMTILNVTLLCTCDSLEPFLKLFKETNATNTALPQPVTLPNESDNSDDRQPAFTTTLVSVTNEPSVTTSDGDYYDSNPVHLEALVQEDYTSVRHKRNVDDVLYKLITTSRCLPNQDSPSVLQYYMANCIAADIFIPTEYGDVQSSDSTFPSKSLQTALMFSTIGVGSLLLTLFTTVFIRHMINRSKRRKMTVTKARQAKMGVVSEEPIYDDDEEC